MWVRVDAFQPFHHIASRENPTNIIGVGTTPIRKLSSLIAMEAAKCTGDTRHERPDEQ
jgi:hypothetical protein